MTGFHTSASRSRAALLATVLAAGALATALYLALVKLAGGVPVCGPLAGCETVNTSPYSEFLGIPVALFGAAGSLALLAGAFAWWRSGNRRGLLVVYGVGLASLPVLAYLTYLEVAVIGAICAWCVTYAILTAVAWSIAAREVARRPPPTR